MKKRQVKGFTLIELMIVVAVIGIIGAIAIPSYMEHVKTSKRSDCAAALSGLAGAMERFFTQNSTYIGASIGVAAADIYPAQCPIFGGGDAYYNLSIDAATANTFTVSAAPVQTDKCGTLTLTNSGLRGVTGAAAGNTADSCW